MTSKKNLSSKEFIKTIKELDELNEQITKTPKTAYKRPDFWRDTSNQ